MFPPHPPRGSNPDQHIPLTAPPAHAGAPAAPGPTLLPQPRHAHLWGVPAPYPLTVLPQPLTAHHSHPWGLPAPHSALTAPHRAPTAPHPITHTPVGARPSPVLEQVCSLSITLICQHTNGYLQRQHPKTPLDSQDFPVWLLRKEGLAVQFPLLNAKRKKEWERDDYQSDLHVLDFYGNCTQCNNDTGSARHPLNSIHLKPEACK